MKRELALFEGSPTCATHTLGYLALFLLAAPVIVTAQELGLKRLPVDLPEAYVVKKGDTLWDISRRYLGDPFSWPQIWKKNEFIRDPHWIYPGQTLTFGLKPTPPAPPAPAETPVAAPASEEKPAVQPPREPEKIASVVKAPETAPPVDPNVIQLLLEPRQVFTEKNYMRTGFIAKRSDISRKRVVSIEGEQGGAIRYDTVVIDMGSQDGVKEGDLLAVIAVGDRVKHPNTGVDYGFVVRIKGVLRAVSVGSKSSRCEVRETFDPLAVDDPVMLYRLFSGPLFDAWVKPDAKIRGVILAINEPMLSIHTNDILYIDKGARVGVRPGDHFTVFARTSNLDDTGYRTPLGELEAISVMPGETAVIVLSLKGETIAIGERVELTARCRLVKK